MISRVKAAVACAGLLAAGAVALTPAPAAAVTFGPPSYVGVWGDPFAIATPDLNGDGHPDLVVGIAGEVGAEVVTLLGNGHGGFEHEEQYELKGGAVFGLAVADLEGDGKLDVAVAQDGAPGEDVGVLRGEGNGRLREPATYFNPGGEIPEAIAAAPFTGKALPDLVVGNSASSDVTLLENESTPGKLAFTLRGPFATTGHTPVAIAVADFNQDGIPDVAVADDDEGGSGFTILDGTGKAGGLKEVGFTSLGQNVVGVASGDFNGDGYPDLAFVDYVGGLSPKGAVYVLLNNKHGGFEPEASYDTTGRPLSIATADIDGSTDLIVGEDGRDAFEEGHVLLLQNNGSGTFSEAGRFVSEEGFGPILGTDLTGDGAADVLEGVSNGTVATLLDIGEPSPSPTSLTFGSIGKGEESAPQSVTITNTGAAPMTIEGLALAGATPGAFDLDDASLALGGGTCTGASLPPGASCAANVAFRPTETGAVAATLLVFSEGAANPASVALSGTGAPPALPPLPPLPKPTISAVHQSASSWREGSKLAQISKSKKPPLGTTFSFTLNEQASVGLAFTKTTGGREVGGKCVVPSAKNRHRRSCKRTVVAGTLSFTGRSGTNKIVFQGRISHSLKLAPGHYRLLITATNAAGVASAPASLSFTIAS
jgi:hypothetical protein